MNFRNYEYTPCWCEVPVVKICLPVMFTMCWTLSFPTGILTIPLSCRRNLYILGHKFSRLLNILSHYTSSDQNSWLSTRTTLNAFPWQIPHLTRQLWHSYVYKSLAAVKCRYTSPGNKTATEFKFAPSCKEHRLIISHLKDPAGLEMCFPGYWLKKS